MPRDYEDVARKLGGTAMLATVGGFAGVVIGGAVGGPIGMIVGGVVGVAIGVGVGVVLYLISESEQAELTRGKEKLAEERSEFDQEMVSTRKAMEQKAHKDKAEMEDLFEEKRLELAIEAGIRKIKIVKNTIEMLEGFGVPLEKIKAHIKKEFPDDVFFAEDIRDPSTHELLDDCVLAQDGRHYNRSALIRKYQQALKEGTVPLCLKNPSGHLLNPATLSTDSILQAKLQMLRKVGLSAALATPPVTPTSRTPVSSTPPIDLVKTKAHSQAEQKFLVSSREEYYGFFPPEKEPISPTPAQPLSFAERISKLNPEVVVVVGESVTQRMH